MDEFGDFFDLNDDVIDGRASILDQPRTVVHPRRARADEGLDLLGCLGTASCQRADFTGDNRKAAALFTRPRRLDGCIQGQDVGLKRDAVNDRDDVSHLLRAGRDVPHRVDHVAHDLAAALGGLAGRASEPGRLAGRIRILFHRRTDLAHGSGSLLQVRRLLLRPMRQIGIAAGDL